MFINPLGSVDLKLCWCLGTSISNDAITMSTSNYIDRLNDRNISDAISCWRESPSTFYRSLCVMTLCVSTFVSTYSRVDLKWCNGYVDFESIDRFNDRNISDTISCWCESTSTFFRSWCVMTLCIFDNTIDVLIDRSTYWEKESYVDTCEHCRATST
jgi:hypothetical protein